MEYEDPTKKDLSARVIDIVAPVGKGQRASPKVFTASRTLKDAEAFAPEGWSVIPAAPQKHIRKHYDTEGIDPVLNWYFLKSRK